MGDNSLGILQKFKNSSQNLKFNNLKIGEFVFEAKEVGAGYCTADLSED